MNRRGFCKAAVAIPPLVAWQTHASLMVVSGNRAEAGAGGGGGSSSYTATHYVAPFASAAGSPANDYVDQGATVWANAASSGTPCNLGTAMVHATSGNAVQVGPGDYVGPQNGDRLLPSFKPSGSGSAESPIIFFAEVPAATNPSSGSLSRLRNNGSTGDTFNHVTYGTHGKAPTPNNGEFPNSYIIFDGFYTDQSNGSGPQPSGGQLGIFDGTGIEVRRALFDRTTVGGGDNFAGIFIQNSVDCVISDCRFRGGTSNSSHNDAAINMYGCTNITQEYCTFEANPATGDLVGCATFVKAAGSASGNDGVIRFCLMKDKAAGGACTLEVNSANESRGGMDIYQNIVLGGGGRGAFSIDVSSGNEKKVQVYNNTFVDSDGDIGDAGGVITLDGIIDEDQVTFKDNIVAHLADSGSNRGLIFLNDCQLDQMAEWDWNFYHMLVGSPKFRYFSGSANDYTSVAAWSAAWSGSAEANSSYGTDPFEDYATEDFHISSGHAALTASSIGGPVGAYITGSEEIGVRASPTY